jgi:catechol 2,3-dioxygenase-like lactoylglutathione lyase family enzyme
MSLEDLTEKARVFYSIETMVVPESRLQVARPVQGIDHVTISTRDSRAAKRFYELALRPLGFSVVFDWPDGGRAYLGLPSEPSSLWLVEGGEAGRVALSLSAADRRAVDAFFAAAVAAGARPLSAPASRPEYTASTYAAEVLDPDGNAVEAICRSADPARQAAHAA